MALPSSAAPASPPSHRDYIHIRRKAKKSSIVAAADSGESRELPLAGWVSARAADDPGGEEPNGDLRENTGDPLRARGRPVEAVVEGMIAASKRGCPEAGAPEGDVVQEVGENAA